MNGLFSRCAKAVVLEVFDMVVVRCEQEIAETCKLLNASFRYESGSS